MFHDVAFDAEGVPIVPQGVDEDIWRLELPSILGIAWSGGRLLNDVSGDEPSEHWEGDESGTHASSCCSADSMLSEAEEFLRSHVVGENVIWGSQLALPGEYWSLPPEGHTFVLDVPPLLGAQLPSHPAELLAYRLLHRGSLHSMHFAQLIDVLPDSRCHGGSARQKATLLCSRCVRIGRASWHHACNDGFSVGNQTTCGGSTGLLPQPGLQCSRAAL